MRAPWLHHAAEPAQYTQATGERLARTPSELTAR